MVREHHIGKSNCQVCLEATGVYSQAISYYLTTQGYRVSVEPPLRVKRTFHPVGHKSDPVDSRQIAEYAYRFQDELTPWQPKDDLLEKIRQLLSVREQFVKQQTAIKNAIAAYRLQKVQVPLIVKAHRETLGQLERQIERIEKELVMLIREDPHILQKFHYLKSIPGFGMLLPAHLLVMTDGFTKIDDYKRLASFIGIVPYEYLSGSSIHKKPRIRHYGPSTSKKALTPCCTTVCGYP